MIDSNENPENSQLSELSGASGGSGSSGSVGDAEVAAAAARAGADVVRAMYGQRLSRIEKGGGDFATAADMAAEEAIVEVVRAARPNDALLGEEGGQRGADGAGRQWLVDPLCGTLNYAVGNMLVAVNVGLRDGASAVADPFSGEVFRTDGTRAWVRHEGVDTPLAPTSATRLVDVNLDPPFPSAPGFRAVDLLAHPAFVERFRPRVVSSTLALAWVAAGRRAAYVTDGGDLSRSVHFAAGIALCRAAGCVVTGIDGAPLGETTRGLVVAADAETHEELMSMIRALPAARPAAQPPTAPSAPLPRATKVLSIGLHPSTLDYSKLPEDLDEATLTARIAVGTAALRDSGLDVVTCLIAPSPDLAEQAVREQLGQHSFGLAMIGGGVRMLPESTLLFERLINVLTEAVPGIRLAFNTSPETTIDALRRWIP